jgi:hypothetical protein
LLKLEPEIVTMAPGAPLAGLKLLIVGEGNTVKLVELVIVMPLVVTEMGPVKAPTGTVVVILVAPEVVTIEGTPLNETIGEALKNVPEIITVAPTAPLSGLNPVIVGVGSTVKSDKLEMVTPLTDNDIFPVVAPGGTVVVILVAEDEDTVATVPLKRTIFSSAVRLKFVPDIVTVVPTAPEPGVKDVIVGDDNTVKLVALVSVMPLDCTMIGPVAAPEGTEVVMEVVVRDVIIASIPLNVTAVLFKLKLVPVIITVAPVAPLSGLNPVMVGVGRTVKTDGLLETVTPFNVTVTGPVVAPTGTIALILLLLGFALVTTAIVPLKRTT